MAEPNTLEWMTEQRDRLKEECDKANSRADANDVAIKAFTKTAAENELLTKQVAELETRIAAVSAKAEEDLTNASQRLAECKNVNDVALKVAGDALAELQALSDRRGQLLKQVAGICRPVVDALVDGLI